MPAVVALKPAAKAVFMTRPESSTRKLEVTCSTCNLRELCLPGGVCLDDVHRIEKIVYARRRIKRGETLIEDIALELPALQRHLHAVLSREIVRDHGVMMLLGSMRAEGRLAAFLINLSKRLVRRGYSASDFHLRMTREESGSYLGLKLETVSRLFSQFQKDGLIEVNQKHVRILDIAGLERVLSSKE